MNGVEKESTVNQSVIAIIVERIQSHLKSAETFHISNRTYRSPVRHLTCRDGTRISVQAGEHAYSTPRNNDGPWTHVEVMMVSKTTPIYFDYPEGDVAGYVPIELVAQELLSRGNFCVDYS